MQKGKGDVRAVVTVMQKGKGDVKGEKKRLRGILGGSSKGPVHPFPPIFSMCKYCDVWGESWVSNTLKIKRVCPKPGPHLIPMTTSVLELSTRILMMK